MREKSTKSRDISERLRQEILGGKFDVTRKLPSEHQLMRRFSVARETVRAALKDLLDKKLVERRPGYGTFLADLAETKAAQKFAMIVPDAYYPFYARICRGIEDAAKKHGWTILTAALGSGSMRERALRAVEFSEVCIREKVSGVFFQPLQFLRDGEKMNRGILKLFKAAGIPVVLLDSDFVTPPNRSEYDLVGVDNTGIGYALAKHVIAAGAKKIMYFSNPLPAPTSLKRGTGVGIAVTEAGLPWKRESVYFADPTDTRAAARVFAGKSRPDAIIAVNDYIASILLKTLKAIGKRVPEDVLLAGVNGDPLAEESIPPITTVVQPCHEIGATAVSLMFERLANPDLLPREVFLSANLLERESTRAKGNGRAGAPRTPRTDGEGAPRIEPASRLAARGGYVVTHGRARSPSAPQHGDRK